MKQLCLTSHYHKLLFVPLPFKMQCEAVHCTVYGIAKCMAIVLFFCWLGTVLTPLGFAFQNGLRYFLKDH